MAVANFQKFKNEKEASHLPFLAAIEAWPSPVNPEQLFDDLIDALSEYVYCDHETAVATVLWSIGTHFVDHCQIYPMAMITAPEAESGKSTLMDFMMEIVARPLNASHATTSSLFRVLEYKPTLLIDETDTFVAGNEELRGLLNSGHSRSGAVLRCDGKNNEVTSFPTYGAKSLSGIGNKTLHETLVSRSIILEMGRKPKEIRLKNISANKVKLMVLKRKIVRFEQDVSEVFLEIKPTIPSWLGNRQEQNWTPILKLASLAGTWQEAAYLVCETLTARGKKKSTSEALLESIREIFDTHGDHQIKSAILLDDLVKMEDSRWAAYNRGGKPIAALQVANILKEHKIFPEYDSRRTARHYSRASFEKAWEVYLG